MASSAPILRPPHAEANRHQSRYSAMATEDYRRNRAEELREDLPMCHPWLRKSWLLCGVSSGILLLGVVLFISGAMIAGTTMKNSGLSVIYVGVAFTIIAIIGFCVFGWLFNGARTKLRIYLHGNRWLAQRRSQPPVESDYKDLPLEPTTSSSVYATRDRGWSAPDQQGGAMAPRIKTNGHYQVRPPSYSDNSIKLPLPSSNNGSYINQNCDTRDFNHSSAVNLTPLVDANTSNYVFVNNAYSGTLTRQIQPLEPRELMRSSVV